MLFCTIFYMTSCSFLIKFTIAEFALDPIVHLSLELLKLRHFCCTVLRSLRFRCWSSTVSSCCWSTSSMTIFIKWFWSLLTTAISIYSRETFLWRYLCIKFLTGLHSHSELHRLQLPFIWRCNFRLHIWSIFVFFLFSYFHISDRCFLLRVNNSLSLWIKLFSFFHKYFFTDFLMPG